MTRTPVNWFTLDSGSPTATMFTAWNLEKLCGDFYIITFILEHLYPALTRVKVSPGVTIEAISLITRVSDFY